MFVPSLCTAVQESSQVSSARRSATELARLLDFSDVELGTVGVVVTETANNLVKHARHGRLLFRALHGNRGDGIEILSIDRGPGMADVARCLADGYSTAGSPGTGLGAITRMASAFDIFSQPGTGTVMVIQIWSRAYAAEREAMQFEVGAVSVPIAHERVSGDGWSFAWDLTNPRLMLVDGLGHGAPAAQAASEAVRIFEQYAHEPPVVLVGRIHKALAPTRGAAMAILEFDAAHRSLCFTGVGNISGRMWDSTIERNFVSNHGIVGHEVRTIREYQYPWPAGATVVMASDGLQTRWTVDAYPGLRLRHPSVLAGVLYRDFQRERDDITVVAVRELTRQGG